MLDQLLGPGPYLPPGSARYRLTLFSIQQSTMSLPAPNVGYSAPRSREYVFKTGKEKSLNRRDFQTAKNRLPGSGEFSFSARLVVIRVYLTTVSI